MSSDLQAAILNLPDGCPAGEIQDVFVRGFKFGHHSARHSAAELAAARADEVQRLREALFEAQDYISKRVKGTGGHGETVVLPKLRAALTRPINKEQA